MSRLFSHFSSEFQGEDGQTLVEYGLILALIALAALVGMATMSGGIDGMYTTIRGIATAMADSMS